VSFSTRIRFVLVGGVLVGGVTLALGCSTLGAGDDHVNPGVPLWLHRPSGALQVLFSRTLTADSRTSGEPSERGTPEIDPPRGRIFVGTSDHGLYALRATNGTPIWRFETLAPVQSEPLYDPELDAVYFGSNDGALYAVHASDGRLMWRYDTGGEIGRKAVRVGESLFFANAADNLFAVERRTGRSLWRVHRTPALGMEISGYAGPSFDRGAVFFAFSDGHVGAYDMRDGSERWPPIDLSAEAEQSGASEALRYLDVDTTPVPDDLGPLGHVIFVASYAGGVFALDQDRGATLWKEEKVTGVSDLTLWREPSHAANPQGPEFVPDGPMVPTREVLLASGGQSGLRAMDPSTGRTLWHLPLPEGGITLPVAFAGGLLVGTTRYGAFLLSPRDGRPIDGFELGSGFSETPATFGSRGYLLSNNGTLLGIQVVSPLLIAHGNGWQDAWGLFRGKPL
jgi:outer membrane protein assembly factor BamB